MNRSESPPVEPLSRFAGLGMATRSPRLATLSEHLQAAAAGLASSAPGSLDGRLDEVTARLHRVEVLLEELAEEAGVTADVARRLRSLRDAVSVHLSAAASLRLLDLDANAAVVLGRAVDAVQGPTSTPGQPWPWPFYDAG